MQINSNAMGFNSFDFSMTTSSGDKISFSAYDNKSISLEKETDKNTLTLSHKYGYKFSYQGDGLDENDVKEIQDALKNIKPQIQDFVKNANEQVNGIDMTNLANKIKKSLPKMSDLNTKNYASHNILGMFDNILANNKINDEILQNSKRLFDEITKQLDGLSFYA